MCGAIPYGPGHSQAQIWNGSCTVLRGLGFDKVDFIFFCQLVFCVIVAQINSDSPHRGIFHNASLTKSLAPLTRFSYPSHIHALSYTLVEKVFGEQGQARALPFIYICKHRSTRTERSCVSCITAGYGAVLKG